MWCRYARSANDGDDDDGYGDDVVDCDDDEGLWEGADLHIYMHIAYTISLRICIICAIICFKCSSKNINVAGWQNLAAFRREQKWQ